MCCLVQMHEELKLVLQHLPVHGAIHHFSLAQELQASPSLPVEEPLDHCFQGMLHCLSGELWGETVQPLQPPAVGCLDTKPQLKMALIRKHHFLPLPNPPVLLLVGKFQPFGIYFLSEKMLACPLS
jgi:hypothetical protein